MELPVKLNEKNIGYCTLEDAGLYWKLQCRCELVSDRVERLYVNEKKLGVLERDSDGLYMRKTISKSSCPELPPELGYFTLYPEKNEDRQAVNQEETNDVWEGEVLGHKLRGKQEGEYILFPYNEDEPCPCEPLMFLFEVKDGFWRLPVLKTNEEENESVSVVTL